MDKNIYYILTVKTLKQIHLFYDKHKSLSTIETRSICSGLRLLDPLPICSISIQVFSRAFCFVNVPMGLSGRGHHTKLKENMNWPTWMNLNGDKVRNRCVSGTIQLINSHISYLVIALLKQIGIYVAQSGSILMCDGYISQSNNFWWIKILSASFYSPFKYKVSITNTTLQN